MEFLVGATIIGLVYWFVVKVFLRPAVRPSDALPVEIEVPKLVDADDTSQPQPAQSGPKKLSKTALRNAVRRAYLAERRDAVSRAIASKRKVRIVYVDTNGERTTRVVEPSGEMGYSFMGWCELRNDVREFKYERIESIEDSI